MITITKDYTNNFMSKDLKPVVYINAGESVRFLTMDAMADQYVEEDQYIIDENKAGNPATGPVYVNQAKAGMTLKITVEKINVNKVTSMTTAPNAGAFGDEIPELKRKHYYVDDNNFLKFNDKLSFKIRPMIGVIGVAPQYGEQRNAVPYKHGGNMDCKEIIEGSIIYLPVYHDGGLVAVGDVHALMGDGEVCVCGAECGAEVILKFEVIEKSFETILLKSEDKFMTICSAHSIDEAAFEAARCMRRFLEKEVGMELHESARVLSLVGDLRICEVVDPNMCCRMEIPYNILEAYNYEI